MSIRKLLETQFIDISGSQNKTHNFYWGIISKPSENNSRKPHTTFNEHVLNHIVDSKSHGINHGAILNFSDTHLWNL